MRLHPKHEDKPCASTEDILLASHCGSLHFWQLHSAWRTFCSKMQWWWADIQHPFSEFSWSLFLLSSLPVAGYKLQCLLLFDWLCSTFLGNLTAMHLSQCSTAILLVKNHLTLWFITDIHCVPECSADIPLSSIEDFSCMQRHDLCNLPFKPISTRPVTGYLMLGGGTSTFRDRGTSAFRLLLHDTTFRFWPREVSWPKGSLTMTDMPWFMMWVLGMFFFLDASSGYFWF